MELAEILNLDFLAGFLIAWLVYRPKKGSRTMAIFKDTKTGVEYIGVEGCGLMPRLSKTGRQEGR